MNIKSSFITSNDFRRLCPFVFVVPTSKHMYKCFLILVQSFSALHFQESMRWLFPIQTFISVVIHFPSKWLIQEAKTKQQRNKTTFIATRSQVRRQTAVSQRNFFWRVVTGTLHWLASLHCLLYFLAFDWRRPAVLFFLTWTVCLFVKESPSETIQINP